MAVRSPAATVDDPPPAVAAARAVPPRRRTARAALIGRVATAGPPIAVLIVVLLAWQGVTAWRDVPPYLVPSPTDILHAAWTSRSELAGSLWITTKESVIAFTLSAIAGVLGAVLLAASRTVERSFYPYVIVLQTIPIVATAPIIIIWIGAGIPAVVVIASIMAFFPVLSNTYVGLRATDARLKDLFELLDAGPWQTLRMLRIRSALPYLVGGLRISSTLSVIGAIVGEYIAGIGNGQAGLGYVLTQTAIDLQTPLLFAAAISSSVLGIAFFQLVKFLSRLLLGSWHESEMAVER